MVNHKTACRGIPRDSIRREFALGVLFVIMGFASTVIVAISVGGVGRLLPRNPMVLRWQGKVVGGICCALGVPLALREK